MSPRSSSASRIRACFALDASEALRFKVLDGGGTFVGGGAVGGGARSSRSDDGTGSSCEESGDDSGASGATDIRAPGYYSWGSAAERIFEIALAGRRGPG